MTTSLPPGTYFRTRRPLHGAAWGYGIVGPDQRSFTLVEADTIPEGTPLHTCVWTKGTLISKAVKRWSPEMAEKPSRPPAAPDLDARGQAAVDLETMTTALTELIYQLPAVQTVHPNPLDKHYLHVGLKSRTQLLISVRIN